jgi:hypothetical protein
VTHAKNPTHSKIDCLHDEHNFLVKHKPGNGRGSTFLKSLLPKERRVEKIPKNPSIDILAVLVDIRNAKVKEQTIMTSGSDKESLLSNVKNSLSESVLHPVDKSLLINKKLLDDRQSIADCVAERMQEIKIQESVTIVFKELDQPLAPVENKSNQEFYVHHLKKCYPNRDGGFDCY